MLEYKINDFENQIIFILNMFYLEFKLYIVKNIQIVFRFYKYGVKIKIRLGKV